jgi:Transmembrane protein of unknown function (DUF3556)
VFLKPTPTPYDPLEWEKKPFEEKARMVCAAWALQGYGSPLAIYLVYALKVALYVAGFVFFCGFTPGMGRVADLGAWVFRPEAFQKAILWSLLFEIVGLGCGSGPLTGRYVPPIGGALYFLRPGTTKLALFPRLPVIGGDQRTLLDVGLYALHAALVIAALSSATPDRRLLVAIALCLPVLGILDKTLFLSARGEHYWTAIAIFALGSDFVPGAKGLWAALWFWAGVSKLNHHFPSVVAVMTSNSPFTRFGRIRRAMYRSYPDHLNPSRLATAMAHAGTALELSVPLVLLAGHGGTVTVVGIVLMLMLHGFITSNVPMGVPLEWNVMTVYGGLFLFWKHADAGLGAMAWPVAALLVVVAILVPLLGNLFPARVPFLLAMRYYAGNWAYSVWLFRKRSHEKLERLTKSSGWIYDQLERMYPHDVCVGLVGKVIAFRLMHLHGRALPELVGKATDRLEDYEWLDGEIVAGLALGWNFGDGHLHDEALLAAVQRQCEFDAGELRVVMVESQPLGRDALHYRIFDAKTGLFEAGDVRVSELRRLEPWGAPS